ncbi:MAG: hypothetical protein V3U22_07590, partial [Vicinamibacteria bacterium]
MRTRDKLERHFKSRPATDTSRRTPAGLATSPSESLSRLERELLGQVATDDDALSVKERLERLVAVTTKTPAERSRKVPHEDPRRIV